jgi:hypothetical protein
MAIPKFLKAFIDVAKTGATPVNKKITQGQPGSGHKRMAEGEVTKRNETSEGIFGSKPFINRYRFREQLKKVSGKIPGGGVYNQKERLSIEKELFPREKFGQYVTPYEMSRRIKDLKHKLFRSGNATEKIETRRQIKFLEKLRGEKKDA